MKCPAYYLAWYANRCACDKTFSPGSEHSRDECHDVYSRERAQANHWVLPWGGRHSDPSLRADLIAAMDAATPTPWARVRAWWSKELL